MSPTDIADLQKLNEPYIQYGVHGSLSYSFLNCYTADCDDDDCTDKEDDKKEGGKDNDEGDGGGEGDSGNVEAEEAKLKVEAQILDILSALLFSPRGGSNVKLWAGRLLARCVCLRMASSPMRLLQATNHADLQDALPPIECYQLNLPETLNDEADDFITTLAITSASEGTIVVGTSQGMVRSIPWLIMLNDKEFLDSCFSCFFLFTNANAIKHIFLVP